MASSAPAGQARGCGGAAARLELQRAAGVVPDPGWLIDDHDAGGLVGVPGLAGSRLDHYVQHPDLVVVQEDPV